MERMVGYPELRAAGVHWTKAYLRRLEAQGLFPQRVRLGPKTVMWLESEVQAWQRAFVEKRSANGDNGDDEEDEEDEEDDAEPP